MIASLSGEVISLGEDNLVVQIGGLGIRVFVPASLRGPAQLGESVFLHTYLVVREESLTLFGFSTEEDRYFFQLLIGVNGVGPRTALAVLSTLSIDMIRRAVLAEQPDVFARVPGVGRKTGQKIVLHMQGKVGGDLSMLSSPTLDIDTQVLDALTSLGYSVVEAQAALQSIPKDIPLDVEIRLRHALQFFSR